MNTTRAGWLLLTLLLPTAASASPWTLRRGRAVVQAGFDFQLANSEFINEGPERSFPLNGRFSGTSLNLTARLGITDRFEMEVGLPIKFVNYRADPAIIQTFEGSDPDAALRHYQNNVLDFSQSGAGVGDLNLAGRYQFLLNPVALASELRITAPTGYAGPEGTFGPEPQTVEAFVAAGKGVVTPSNIRDDVTLGDGQLDMALQVLVGRAFSTGTFIRAGAGYKLRLGGAGDQVLGDLRLGQALGRRLLIYGFGRIAYTVQQGRSVGVTVTADDPDLPASAYANGVNTRPIVRRLEHNRLDVGGGLIWRIVDTVEFNLGYGRTVWGRFTAATNTVSLGIGVRANLFDDDPI